MSKNSIDTVTRLEGRPLTEKEMIEKFDIDSDLWEAERLETSVHEGQQKDQEGNPVILSMYRTMAKRKRRYPEEIDNMLSVINKVIENSNITGIAGFKDYKINHKDLMATIDLFDIHINKRDKYNTPIPLKLKGYDRTIEDLLGKIKKHSVQQIILVIGGDLMETDHKGGTTKGTPVDHMVDEKDAMDITSERVIKTVEKLRKEYKVSIYFVLGNHDNNVLYYLSLIMQAVYKDSEVEIFTGSDRHYIERGKTLLQLLHGDEKNFRSFMMEYLQHSKKDFDHLYSKSGHTHREAMQMLGPMKSVTHPSGSKRNKRADKNGYDPKPGIQASIYHKTEGEYATFTSYTK